MMEELENMSEGGENELMEENFESEKSEDELVSDQGEEGEMEVDEAQEDQKSSEVSDLNIDDYSSSSQYDSDELDQDNNENPHGFVYSNMLDTFQKSRRDRIEDLRAQKEENHDEHRSRFKRKANKNQGKIGKSERVHQKNKPFMMVKKKKIQKLQESISSINRKKRRDKRFMGHFRKATKQRLEARKSGRK